MTIKYIFNYELKTTRVQYCFLIFFLEFTNVNHQTMSYPRKEREPPFVFRINDGGQGPDLVRQMLLDRGWVEFDEEEHDEWDWNLWWKTTRFRNSEHDQLLPCQRLNHFKKATAITKKDSLARHMKCMLGIYGPNVYNFSPVAFNLPNDYTKFVAQYTKLKDKSGVYWICKPADMSRGRGIFLFKNLSDLQYDCNAVVQRYISNPLLVSGYKFDLRIYVVVTSFDPLCIYIYEEGLSRFSTEKYDLNNLGNAYSHLTNTSINKYSPMYNADKERVGPGCKWTLTQLRHYFHQSNIDDCYLWTRVTQLIIMTILIQAQQMEKSTGNFELYGFDIMVDDHLKPWLLEVNFSPALAEDCQIDVMVKKPMLHDIVDLLCFKEEDRYRTAEFNKYVKNTRSHGGGQFEAFSRQPPPPRQRSSRLPTIRRRSSSMVSSQQLTPPEDKFSKDEVIPGCGLPNVQKANNDSVLVESRSSTGCSSQENNDFHQDRRMAQSARNFNSKEESSKLLTSRSSCDVKDKPLPVGKRLTRRSSNNYILPDDKKKIANRQKVSSAFTTKILAKKNPSPRRFSVGRTSSLSGVNLLTGSVSMPDVKSPGVKRVFSSRVLSPRYGNNGINMSNRFWKPPHNPSSQIEQFRRMSKRVGDFLLVFPFNETTIKNAATNLDSRLVIKECFKQLKQRPILLQQVHEKAIATNQPELLHEFLWPPLKFTETLDK